jgi:hypothetical protein
MERSGIRGLRHNYIFASRRAAANHFRPTGHVHAIALAVTPARLETKCRPLYIEDGKIRRHPNMDLEANRLGSREPANPPKSSRMDNDKDKME